MKFNKLIPELEVNDLDKSLDFYVKTLGFKIEYARPEDKFVFLSLQGSQIMIQEEKEGESKKGAGLVFQIEVNAIEPFIKLLNQNNYNIKEQIRERWFRKDNKLVGMKAFIVSDPDGFDLMIFKDLGEKKLS